LVAGVLELPLISVSVEIFPDDGHNQTLAVLGDVLAELRGSIHGIAPVDVGALDEQNGPLVEAVPGHMDLILPLALLLIVFFERLSHREGRPEGRGGILEYPERIFELNSVISCYNRPNHLQGGELEVQAGLGAKLLLDFFQFKFVHHYSEGSQIGMLEQLIQLLESLLAYFGVVSTCELH